MIKKLLLLIIFFIFVLTQATFAQEVSTKETFKVTSVNFDTSNSMIFLTSPDNTTEPILKNIKLTKLSNPKRAFFDINSAVMTAPPQNWYFNSGGLKQVKIGQFSTNPNKIRVVMYFDENFNPQKVGFFRVNNNLIIKLKDGIGKNEEYFQGTYRDERLPNSAFYENLAITSEDISKVQIAVNTSKKDDVLGQIQQAFNASTAPEVAIKSVSAPKPEVVKKDLKLRSKYYINGITTKTSGVLISGIGSVGVQKPIYLTSPARVVFDIPNATVSPEFKSKEFKLSDKETVKVGQFDSNNVRVVITSDELEKYVPVFSADDQSLLIANPDKLDIASLFSKTTDAVAYYFRNVNSQTDEFTVAFNAPVVHSVKRDSSKVTIYLYNALRFNEKTFQDSIKATTLKDMKMDLMPKIGLKITLPLKKENTVNVDLGSDAKSIRILVKGPKVKIAPIVPPKIIKKASVNVSIVSLKGNKKVVLDPGHGGADYGAIRAGINEKDINLDVAKRVESILTSKGVSVAMTRDRDETVSLQERTVFTDNKKPNIFVSIHVNSSTGTQATGLETHYYHPESIELAKVVHTQLAACVKSPDRGLFKSRFYVINHTSVPAILVEIGFISNDRERAELVSEQRKQQTAKAIADGILIYLSQQNKK